MINPVAPDRHKHHAHENGISRFWKTVIKLDTAPGRVVAWTPRCADTGVEVDAFPDDLEAVVVVRRSSSTVAVPSPLGTRRRHRTGIAGLEVEA